MFIFYLMNIIKLMYIYLYIYMLAIAGQTAGPNGLKFFYGTRFELFSDLEFPFRPKRSSIFSPS